MADITLKRGDSWEPLKATLRRKNPETEEWEPIDLSTALRVSILLKPHRGGTAIIQPCTAWGGGSIKSSSGPTAGRVEYTWKATDLNPSVVPEEFDVEWEIEWPETASVKRRQTVPNGKYRTIAVVQDLGDA